MLRFEPNQLSHMPYIRKHQLNAVRHRKQQSHMMRAVRCFMSTCSFWGRCLGSGGAGAAQSQQG